MEIKDKRILTEMKIIRDRLSEIDYNDMNFDTYVKIARCETSLDILINLIEEWQKCTIKQKFMRGIE